MTKIKKKFKDVKFKNDFNVYNNNEKKKKKNLIKN